MRTLPESYDIQEPKVEYWPTEFDWIGFRITLGDQVFEDRFWSYCDPLPELKRWLEAAAIGVNRCSFWFDDEGREFELELEYRNQAKNVFRVSNYYRDPDEAPLICAYVDRRALIEAFYRPIFALDGDPQIKAKWEVRHYSDEICAELGMTFDETVEYAIGLSAFELQETFFNAAPSFLVRCPDAPEGQGFAECLKAFYGEPSQYEIVHEPMIDPVPDEYDLWTIEQRREYIVNWLNSRRANDGSPIREVRSQIVENYLGDASPIVIAHEIG